MQIRQAQADDGPAILEIILPVIREGATYTLDPDMPEAEALGYWLSPDKETFVAEENGAVVGTYFIRPNQAGGGRHVCNCGYMTHAAALGRGVARTMCQHSWHMPETEDIERCSSTSSSARTSVPYDFGNRWALKSSDVFQRRFDIRCMAMSMHW